MNHKDWPRDPIWQFLGVVVGAVVSIVLAVIGPITLPDKVRLVVVIIVLLGTVLCLILVLKRTLRASNQSPGLAVPKPQSAHPRHSQAKQTFYDDPIVIDVERGDLSIGAVALVLLGSATFISCIVASIQINGNIFDLRYDLTVMLGLLGFGFLCIGLLGLLPFILPRGRLKVGSEGIEYSLGRLFIPWDEMSRIYMAPRIGRSNTNRDYLCVELKERSKLHFLKPIKSRYAEGAIVLGWVTEVTGSASSAFGLPKHLIEYALDIYAPYGVERTRK